MPTGWEPPWWTHMMGVQKKCLERGVEYSKLTFEMLMKWRKEDEEQLAKENNSETSTDDPL